MNTKKNPNDSLITSSELMKITAISRATLNNYIKYGIISKPRIVKKPEDVTSRARIIGYFPREMIDRIEEIKKMKKEGKSMDNIVKLFSKGDSAPVGHDYMSKTDCLNMPDLMKDVIGLISRREKVITDLMKQRLPSLISFCVLVADLQDSSRICAELPPEEYFELIRNIWESTDQIFPKYYGTYGKHVGDGLVYYFLREKDNNYVLNSIYCALELKEQMKKLSVEWKIRKGWFNDLYLNIGINEGQEFFGTIPSSPHIEFTALGDSVNYASRLSDLARYGAIWTTKNLLNRITSEEKKRLNYGVRRVEQGREIFIENMFSRVMDMLRPDDSKYSKFMDIATLPVTEIVSAAPIEFHYGNSSLPEER